MKHVTLLASAAVLLATTSTAAAYYPVKPYAFVDLGAGVVDLSERESQLQRIFNETGALNTSTGSNESGMAYALGFGARFSPHWAAELGFYDLGEFKASGRANNAGNGNRVSFSEDIDINGLGLRGIGRYPLTTYLGVEVSAGVAYMRTRNSQAVRDDGALVERNRESETNLAPMLGLGLSYIITSDFSLRAGITHFNDVGDRNTTGKGDVQFYSVGTTFSF